MQVDFYQLARTPLARVLAQIAGRVVGEGERLLIVMADEAHATEIDAALWTGEDSFLPHGRASGDDPGADQPVLIAGACDGAANGARHLALADGTWRDAALGFARTFYLFDDRVLDAAREAWRALGRVDGVTRNYWSQDEAGRWRKTA